MPAKAQRTLKMLVIAQLMDAYESREVINANALRSSSSPHVAELWAGIVDRQGQILGELAIKPATRAELISSMEGLINRAPAWLDSQLRDERKMTVDLFLQGMAQIMTRQREEIERVVAEQTREPGALEAILRASPLPENPEETERDALMTALAGAVTAHSEVLIGIAAEFDALMQEPRRRNLPS